MSGRGRTLLVFAALACGGSATGDTGSNPDGATGSSTTTDSGAPTNSGPDTTPPDLPPKFDVGVDPWAALSGCPLEAPAGTDIHGDTALGPFTSTRAWFGVTIWGMTPMLAFLGPGADPDVELDSHEGMTGPVLHGAALTDSLSLGWIGTWPLSTVLSTGGEEVDIELIIIIDALAGNWDTRDPDDPPRIIGSVSGPVSGSFDAVYCSRVDFAPD